MLSLSHQKFIKSLTNIVNGLDKDLTERVVQQDNKDFAEICLKLESSCINTFQSIVKEKNDSANLVDAAVTIQRFYRGYKARKEFNKKSKQIMNMNKQDNYLLTHSLIHLQSTYLCVRVCMYL